MSSIPMGPSGTTSSVPPVESGMASGGLARYALWQFRDFAWERALPILLLGVCTGAVILRPAQQAAEHGLPVVLSLVIHGWIRTMGPLFVFLAVNRIVSGDRISGAFRFLFSRPVSVPWFYAQMAAVHAVGYFACWAVLIEIGRLTGLTAPWPLMMENAAVMFVGFGGFYFLVSVLTRYDLWMAWGIWFVSYIAYQVWGDSQTLMSKVVYLLPPAHRLGVLLSSGATDIVSDVSADLSRTVAWVVGYGLVCFLLGLIVLARKPFAVN